MNPATCKPKQNKEETEHLWDKKTASKTHPSEVADSMYFNVNIFMSMLIAASSFGKVEAPGESASLGTKAEAADLPNRCQLTPGPLNHIINIMKNSPPGWAGG